MKMPTEQAVAAIRDRWLDRPVRVATMQPHLTRFEGLAGVVKAVNMNGRCLVQFDHGQDVGWYDLDPAVLAVIPETAAE